MWKVAVWPLIGMPRPRPNRPAPTRTSLRGSRRPPFTPRRHAPAHIVESSLLFLCRSRLPLRSGLTLHARSPVPRLCLPARPRRHGHRSSPRSPGRPPPPAPPYGPAGHRSTPPRVSSGHPPPGLSETRCRRRFHSPPAACVARAPPRPADLPRRDLSETHRHPRHRSSAPTANAIHSPTRLQNRPERVCPNRTAPWHSPPATTAP
jgi:hypothetical protein